MVVVPLPTQTKTVTLQTVETLFVSFGLNQKRKQINVGDHTETSMFCSSEKRNFIALNYFCFVLKEKKLTTTQS